MKGIVQRFNLASEVIPIFLVGALLDVVGRYLCGYAGAHDIPGAKFIFLDMIGTAYAAVMLGPWWGAAVGIFSAIINGNFYGNYFPFGVVNVCGGITWGYLAAGLAVRRNIGGETYTVSKFLKCLLVLLIGGVLMCGVASFVVQLTLFPPMDRPLIRDSWYKGVQFVLSSFGHRYSGEVPALFVGALSREFADKTLTIVLALIFVTCHATQRSSLEPRLRDRLRDDAVAIFAFVCTYSIYLCFARVYRPTILFEGGKREIGWLSEPYIIALLYFPFLLAIASLLLNSLDRESSFGREIEADRLRRKQSVVRILSEDGWRTFDSETRRHFEGGKKLYGLLVSVLAWPIGKITGVQSVEFGLLYCGGTLVMIGYFFYQNRKVIVACRNYETGVTALRSWFDIRGEKPSSEMLSVLVKQLAGPASKQFLLPSLLYSFVEAKADGQGSGGKEDKPKSYLVAVSLGSGAVSEDAQRTLTRAVAAFNLHAAIVLCASPRSEEMKRWQVATLGGGAPLLLTGFVEAERIIECGGNTTKLSGELARQRVAAAADALGGEPSKLELLGTSASSLASRALPGLAHVMQRLPASSIIFDLGAGRGRHTALALSYGFNVLAVERKQAAYEDLCEQIKGVDQKGRGTAVLGDYSVIDLEKFGPAALVVVTGVLQHVTSKAMLCDHLTKIRDSASAPCAQVYIEMLFDMKFDGEKPTDGRLNICQSDFEDSLADVFDRTWRICRVSGPDHRVQTFDGPRSFYPPARRIELTSAEYLLLQTELIG